MANLSEQLIGEIESHPVVGGLTEHDALCSPASLGVFHFGGDVSGVVRPGQSPVMSPSMIQHSLSAGDVDSCACNICHQVFSSSSARATHVQLAHAGHKPFECGTCGKCFANSSYLSQHNRIHLGVKPYRCQLCDRRFTQLCHLQQHIRTHTGEKPYRCRHPGCAKAFSQLSNLQSHMRSHMTDKPYRCNSCYRCFGDEQSLQEHIPKHSETKHLKTKICTICGKSYAQETYLARHMAKHTSANEFKQPEGGNAGVFGVAPYSLQDFAPRSMPHDLLGSVPCMLPSFPAFRAGGTSCAGGLTPFFIDATKIPDALAAVNPSVKSSFACGAQSADLLPFTTQQSRSAE